MALAKKFCKLASAMWTLWSWRKLAITPCNPPFLTVTAAAFIHGTTCIT